MHPNQPVAILERPDEASRFQAEPWPAPDAAALAMPTGLRLAIVLAAGHVLTLAGLMPHYFMDDAYIGFRCVANFLAGDGFAFNPGERVEAVTNIGWLMLLVPGAAVLPVTFVAKLLGTLLMLGVIALVPWLAWRLDGRRNDLLFLLPLPLLIAGHEDFFYFSLSGMETSLLAAGLGVTVALAFGERRETAMAALCAGLFTVHPEAVGVYPLAVLLRVAINGQPWRRFARPLAIFAMILLLITVGRWLYFGDTVPNTFHAKPTSIGGVVLRLLQTVGGTNVNVSYPFVGMLALPFLAAGTVAVWRRDANAAAVLVAAVATGFAFAAYSQPDWTATGRYFAPYAPLALLLLWRGFVDIGRQVLALAGSEVTVRRVLGGAATLIIIAGMVRSLEPFSRARVQSYPGYVLTGVNLVEPACWMRDALPPDAVVATRRIGVFGYYADKRVFDYTFGLCDRDVAQLIRAHGRRFYDPRDPALAALWRSVQPDYLLEDVSVLTTAARAAGGTLDDFTLHGDRYRLIRRFRIGDGAAWGLCERIAPASDEVALAEDPMAWLRQSVPAPVDFFIWNSAL